MATTRPHARVTTAVPLPPMPAFDPGPFVRMTTDMVAQASRQWIDLWFANLHRASALFWDDVGARQRAR